MKVGILTYVNARNYGAFLQAYSLCSILNLEGGIEAELIDYSMKKEIEHYQIKIDNFFIKHPINRLFNWKISIKQRKLFAKDSLNKLKKSKNKLITDSIEEFTNFVKGKYDVIIAGSDEIWKTNGFRGFPTPYWLIGDLNCRKFSYAASARNSFGELSRDNLEILKKAINDFEFVGVRDHATFEEIIKYNTKNDNTFLCCDPTFLYEFNPNPENGRRILDKILGKKSSKKYIGIMTEDRQLAKKIAKELKNDYEIFSLYEWQRYCKNACELSPFEWLDVISSLDLLITSYFHAVCFSIKFGTSFIAFGTQAKKNKVIEVLVQTNKTDAFVDDLNEIADDKEKLEELVIQKMDMPKEMFVLPETMMDGYNKMLQVLRNGENNE